MSSTAGSGWLLAARRTANGGDHESRARSLSLACSLDLDLTIKGARYLAVADEHT